MSRRRNLITIMVVFVCLSIGFFMATAAHSSSQKFEGQTLVVGVWSGPWAESMKKAVGEPFEKMTGAKIAW